jgi:hypothetical protein
MKTFDQLLRAVSKLDIQEAAELALIDARPDFLTRQREQLLQGLRNDDKAIYNVITGSDEYSESYAKRKGKSKPIDLYNTGAWSKGIGVDVRKDELYIFSEDQKDAKLEKNYSPQILGLGTKARETFIPRLKDIFVQNITRKLNGVR